MAGLLVSRPLALVWQRSADSCGRGFDSAVSLANVLEKPENEVVAMSRLLSLTAVSVVALATGACATSMTVSSHVERGLNFNQYRTYDWGPTEKTLSGDLRLE